VAVATERAHIAVMVETTGRLPIISKAHIDRLGERLALGAASELDLRGLDQYRRSFSPGYERLLGIIRDGLHLHPTGRPAKSTTSIRDKLARSNTRLSQMQDIAGCRILVTDVIQQDETVRAVIATAVDALSPIDFTIVDRRTRPSFGYRAVHVIVSIHSKPIEIQLRTRSQHLWAELSEKLSDVEDNSVKYGGGSPSSRRFLGELSEALAKSEDEDRALYEPGGGRRDIELRAKDPYSEKAQQRYRHDKRKVNIQRTLEQAVANLRPRLTS
jgi:putative GTP pyrophosphokinase